MLSKGLNFSFYSCVCVGVCACVWQGCKGQKRIRVPGLELQAVTTYPMWVLGTEYRDLQHWCMPLTKSPTLCFIWRFLKEKVRLAIWWTVDFSYSDCVTGLSQVAETPLVQYALHLQGIKHSGAFKPTPKEHGNLTLIC